MDNPHLNWGRWLLRERTVNTMLSEGLDDGDLVSRSIGGDVEAFREIVARYYLRSPTAVPLIGDRMALR